MLKQRNEDADVFTSAEALSCLTAPHLHWILIHCSPWRGYHVVVSVHADSDLQSRSVLRNRQGFAAEWIAQDLPERKFGGARVTMRIRVRALIEQGCHGERVVALNGGDQLPVKALLTRFRDKMPDTRCTDNKQG